MKKFKYYLRDNSKYLSLLYSKISILNDKNKYLFKRINNFKDIHKNKTCYILGTGPSLNKFDIKKLKNEFTIGINFFFLHPDFKFLNKKYICSAPSHMPLNYDIWDNLLTKLQDHDISQIFIGDSNYEYSIGNFLKNNKDKKLHNLCLLNYHSSPIVNSNNINFSNLHDLGVGPLISPVTTLVTALQIAYYMGFTKINLLGIDHDNLNPAKNSDASNSHFYSEDQNHETHIKYDNKTSIFKWLYQAWTQYEILNEFYRLNKIEIINLNKESYLDVFDKVN